MWGRRGLSLPEVLLATALIALCVYGMMSLLPTSGTALQEAKDIEAARGYAMGEVERIRQNDAQFNYPLQPGDNVYDYTVTLNNSNFNVHRVLRTIETDGPYALHGIVLSLSRDDHKGMPITLSTRVVVVTQ